MKKILMVSCDGLGRGGVQSVLMNIVRNMSEEYTFDIILFTDEVRHYEEEFTSYSGKIFRIPLPKNSFISKFTRYLSGGKIYKQALKIIKENGPYEAVHSHSETDGAFVLKAAKKMKIPTRIVHTHIISQRGHILWNMYSDKCKKLIRNHATFKIGCSDQACIAAYGEGSEWKTVNNPYESNRFTFKKEKGFSSPVLTQIGAFSPTKNQLFTLDILDKIRNTYPDARLNLIGFDLGSLSSINEKVKALNLTENVTFLPCDADSPSVLEESCCLLFPSLNEGFGIVAVEAQAVGVKVFASEGVPSSVNCGGVVFLPLEKSAQYWADEIINDFRQNGGAHKEYDCSPYSLDFVMEQYRNLYGGKGI